MKKSLKVLLWIICGIIILFLIDILFIFIFNKPLFGIKEKNSESDIIYRGLLYDTVICNKSTDTKIILKGFSYSCSYNGGNYILLDKTKEIDDFVCAEALESFYEDEFYTYYWNCLKNKYMIVKYDDGTEESISNALKQKHIDIEVLNKFDIYYIKHEKDMFNKDFKLNIIEEKNCNHKLNEYYKNEGKKVYTACLNEIYVEKNSGSKMTLKYYLENVNQSFDRSINELISDAKVDSVLKDGGTIIYKKDIYTIIKCNTIDGNRDIYIGNKNFKYEQGYCK